jgi:hypothetical protein
VGAPRRSLAIACALALVLVPAAFGAKRDLTVKVAHLNVPATLKSGTKATFGVRYIVRGPSSRSAIATVTLVLRGSNKYTVNSLPAKVRPAIWRWSVQDTVPALAAGSYKATATITLTRAGKTIAHASSTKSVRVQA